MHGIIVIDKPAGITSHDVVSRVRRALRTKRVGHTGTLDPFATGVMVVLVGHATRLARFVDKDEKQYEAVVQFGSETDTGDRTGSPTAESGLPDAELERRVADTEWETHLAKFRGEIMQTPPMYSAKKIDGQRLYELARRGKEIERKPVRVHVAELKCLAIANSEMRISVTCSAGTYIRTLAKGIGRSVGLGAHLTALRRTRSGAFTLDNAVALADLELHSDPGSLLLPAVNAVRGLPEVSLSAERIVKTKNGLASRVECGLADGTWVRISHPDGRLIAIGTYSSDEKTVQPKVVLS